VSFGIGRAAGTEIAQRLCGAGQRGPTGPDRHLPSELSGGQQQWVAIAQGPW
jgi:ABC-type polar amino acid transport system ATPase subunit